MVMLIAESDYWCSSSSPCRESVHDLRLSSHPLQRVQWEQREGNRSWNDWTVSKPCGSNRSGGRIRIGLRTNTVLRHWTTETVHISPCSESISFVISYFEFQLQQFTGLNKPLFLHNRAASKDLYEILEKYREQITAGGVVSSRSVLEQSKTILLRAQIHSFDGTLDEALQFIQLGFFIGLNGCSMKTQANLDVIRQLPLEKLLVETGSSSLVKMSPSTWLRFRRALVWNQTVACVSFACANVVEQWNGEEREMDIGQNGERSQRTMHDCVSSFARMLSRLHESLLDKSVKFCIRFVVNKNHWMIYVRRSIWIRNSCFFPENWFVDIDGERDDSYFQINIYWNIEHGRTRWNSRWLRYTRR